MFRKRKAKMFNFPGALSGKLLHCKDVHLEGNKVTTVLIHIGVNDLLRIMWKIFSVSGIFYATRISLPILVHVHNMVLNFCSAKGLFYIDNRNIRRDGLHLLNFLHLVAKFFSSTHTLSTRYFLNQEYFSKLTSGSRHTNITRWQCQNSY